MQSAIMGWRATYQIASNREATKRGKDHLSEHALEILTMRTEHDAAVMTAAILQAQFSFLRV